MGRPGLRWELGQLLMSHTPLRGMSLLPDYTATSTPTAFAAQKMREALAMLDDIGGGVAACLLQQALDVIDSM